MTIKYFGAEWCNPCKALRPVVEKLAKEYGCKFEYIDVQEAIDECRENAVMGVPTVIFSNGSKEDRITGIKSEEGIREIIKSLM